jgi:serine/threonine-protein kinase
MAKQSKPWESTWEKIDLLSAGGGQGKVSFVERRGSPPGERRFALKELKRQDDPERRKRMHREVAALQTLDHPGIPRCLDSNAAQFDDLDVMLYLVTEFIPGPTLEEYAGGSPIDPDLAIACTLRLLDIIAYCHFRGVVHRDVKPENIVLRGGEPGDPVLLDFGLSFNEEDRPDSVTLPGQELGNRFLHLPELQHPGLGQRDPRADLAQCCGILFYLVTGELPRTLRDQDGRKPHQRDKALAVLNRLALPRRDSLHAVFERGFEHEIDRRFQTAEEMRLSLIDTTCEGTGAATAAEKITAIRATLGLDATYQRHRKYIALLEETARIIEETCREVAEEIFGAEWHMPTDYELDAANLRLNTMRGLFHRDQPDKAFKPRFIALITESQLSVHAHEETGRSTSVFLSPLAGPTDWPRFREAIKRLYIDGIHQAYSGRSPTRLTRPLPEPRNTPFERTELTSLLFQLPLRAIVAFAARCARRAQPAITAGGGESRASELIKAVERAIASAERYAQGDATAASGDAAHHAQLAATAAIDLPPGANTIDFTRSRAAEAAHCAAAAALFARQNGAPGAVACAVQAYEHACNAMPFGFLPATLDLRRLLTSELGQHPHLGSPIEPGEHGLLGPLWPGTGLPRPPSN